MWLCVVCGMDPCQLVNQLASVHDPPSSPFTAGTVVGLEEEPGGALVVAGGVVEGLVARGEGEGDVEGEDEHSTQQSSWMLSWINTRR